MRKFRDLSIMQTIIGTITIIVAVSVIVTVFSAFNIVLRASNEIVYDQAGEINKQIVYNYESYTNRVEDVTNLLQNKIPTYDVHMDEDILEDMFVTTVEIEESIVAISLFDQAGEIILGTRPVKAETVEVGTSDWYMNATFDENIIHFSSPHDQTIYAMAVGEVISVSRMITYTQGDVTRKGVLLIDMNFEGLQALSDFTNLGPSGHLLIMDAGDDIVYSTNSIKYNDKSKSYRLAKEQIFGSRVETIDGIRTVININTISSTRWRIATFQDINQVEQGMQGALITAVIFVLITLSVTIMVAYFVARQITNPLTKLNRSINRLHDGNYDSKVAVEGQREIKTVINGFNEMIDRIRALMDEVVKEQRGKRKTELRALQNQINPHFLYNTLDCIIWLAEKNRNEDLVDTVSALSTYFRVSLSKGKQFIPVSEELRHIESYLLIQRTRYNERFTYSIHCEPTVKDARIMKLILQPLVENAIYHGIDKDDPDSEINIDVAERDGLVYLSVMNSGYGITEDKIEALYQVMAEGNKKGSVGMKNVYRRIKLFYGESARVEIESELDESTTISIVIPRKQLETDDASEGDL